MNNVPVNPQPTYPIFADRIIIQIQDFLLDKLIWLNRSFGRAQKLVTMKEKKKYIYPGIHIRNEKYINVFPDRKLGNYSFFVIEDPQEVDFNRNQFNQIKLKYGLIFWLNLDDVFANTSERNTEAVKSHIIKLLTRDLRIVDARLSITQIYEEANNIYKGFNIEEIDSQFLMHPYAGFRFDGVLSFYEKCEEIPDYLQEGSSELVYDSNDEKIQVVKSN